MPSAAWGKFLGFWFTPADPTTMAFIRIVTGCLALYVHLVYSFDLHAFFGRTAWYDLEAADAQRWEEPSRFIAPGWEHEQLAETANPPDTEGARRAVFAWMRGLPSDPAALAAKLRLIDRNGVLTATRGGPGGWTAGDRPTYPIRVVLPVLDYAPRLETDPVLRGTELKVLAGEIAKDKENPGGGTFLDSLSADDRKAVVRDLEAFYGTLPQAAVVGDPDAARAAAAAADRDRRVIVAYLVGQNNVLRDNLLAFLRDNAAPVPEFERNRRISYLERWGYEERHADHVGIPTFSLWYHVTDRGEMVAAHVGVLVVILLFTVGLFTRVTSVLTWVAAVSYIHRDPQVLFGQDTMMNILLVYLMVANGGAALSLDRVIARYRAARASVARCGGIDGPAAAFLAAPPPSVASGFAQRLLQVHFCFIYMAAGLSKLKGSTWWTGDAMWLTLVNPEFTMIHFEWYQNLVRWAFSSRPVYSTFAAGGVLFTLFAEIGLPFLVWTRLRSFMVVCGFLLHFGVGVFMGLLVFSLFMMTMLLAYLPGAVFRHHLLGDGSGPKRKVPVNPADPRSAHAAAWAVAWDTNGAVEVVKG